MLSHNEAHEDIKVQIISHCDPIHQEAIEKTFGFPVLLEIQKQVPNIPNGMCVTHQTMHE